MYHFFWVPSPHLVIPPPNTAKDKLVGDLSPGSDHISSILLFFYRLHCNNSQCLVPFTSCQSLDTEQGHQLGPNKFLQPWEVSPPFPIYLTLTPPCPQFLLPRKTKGHFYGSNSVTTAKLHAAAFVRGRLRVNGKTITLLLSPQTLQFMKSRSENSSREEGFGREKQSCCRGLTISY